MAQAGFQAGSDVTIINNAQGLNNDSHMSEEQCDANCNLRHIHFNSNYISRTFGNQQQENQQFNSRSPSIPPAHVCNNNCNHHHELSQIERNRMGKKSSFNSGTSKNATFGGNSFIYTHPPKINMRRRNKRKKRNRMEQQPIQPQMPMDFNISERDKEENPEKTNDEIYQILHNRYVSNKMKKQLMNNQHYLEKVINDGHESILTKIQQMERYARSKEFQAKSDEAKNEEAEKNRIVRENNLENVVYYGKDRPRAPKPNRAKINERYEMELSQKREATIFEEEKDIEIENETAKPSMFDERAKKRQEKFEQRESNKWNQFVTKLHSMQAILKDNENKMNLCKLRKQKHNGAQSKLNKKLDLAEAEQKDILDEKQLEEVSIEFIQAKEEYNNIIKELELFDDRIINIQEVTKPTLKHLQAMNKINKRIGNINQKMWMIFQSIQIH